MSVCLYIVTLMIDCDSVSESEANHVLQLCNLLTGCEDALLHEWLLLFELYDLSCHQFVLFLLLVDTVLQVLKIRHDIRIDYFHILVVLGGQVILHESNLLPQHLDLLLVLSEALLRVGNNILNLLDVALDAVLAGHLQSGWRSVARCLQTHT